MKEACMAGLLLWLLTTIDEAAVFAYPNESTIR